MTGAAVITAADARRITDQIKAGVEAVWHLIEQAYTTRAWSALGYQSWDDYCTREFGTSRLRLPREERAEVVASLRESGLGPQAIAAATGLSRTTVRREIESQWPNGHPDPVIGRDGKTYKPKPSDYFPVEGPLPGDREIAPGMTADDLEDLNAPAPQPEPTGPKRKPITDAARDAGWDLRKSVERLQRIADDDRFATSTRKVAPHLRGHLTNAIEVCQDLLERINNN